MKNVKVTKGSNAIGPANLTVLLLIVFVTLKVIGIITWSWWIVILAPLGITMVFYVSAVLLTMLLTAGIALFLMVISKGDLGKFDNNLEKFRNLLGLNKE